MTRLHCTHAHALHALAAQRQTLFAAATPAMSGDSDGGGDRGRGGVKKSAKFSSDQISGRKRMIGENGKLGWR